MNIADMIQSLYNELVVKIPKAKLDIVSSFTAADNFPCLFIFHAVARNLSGSTNTVNLNVLENGESIHNYYKSVKGSGSTGSGAADGFSDTFSFIVKKGCSYTVSGGNIGWSQMCGFIVLS